MTEMFDVYLGTGAYVGRIDGETACAFWPTDPITIGFDKGQLIDLDLAKTAEAAAAGTITYDQVHTEDSKRTFGPRWPLGPGFYGRVYVRETYAAGRIPNPPRGASGRDYEFKLIIYRANTGDPRQGRRYQGVHAEIGASGSGGSQVDITLPGTSLTTNPTKRRVVVDLNDPNSKCSPPAGTTEAVAGTPGALFLAMDIVTAAVPSWPKLPPTAGR